MSSLLLYEVRAAEAVHSEDIHLVESCGRSRRRPEMFLYSPSLEEQQDLLFVHQLVVL